MNNSFVWDYVVVCLLPGGINWEVIVYILSGLSSFVILILTVLLARQCCKSQRWNVQPDRTRDEQTTQETYVLNVQPGAHCSQESTV